MIHVYLWGNYLNKLEKHVLGSLILLNLLHYNHSSLSYDYCQVIYMVYHGKQSLGFLFSDNLSTLAWESAKYSCISLSVHNLIFHNVLHLVCNVVHSEANMCTSNSQGAQNYKVQNVLLNLLWGAQETFVNQKT